MSYELYSHKEAGTGYNFWLDVDESRFMLSRSKGKYEMKKTRLVQKYVKRGMTFLDVGANKGWFTLLAHSLVGREGLVMSFEPSKENIKWLSKSLDDSPSVGPNVELIPYACSDISGHGKLHLAKRSGGHSLEAIHGELESCRCVRLDTFLDGKDGEHDGKRMKVDAIKIDVEGAEMRVLQGMQDGLLQTKPMIFMDMHLAMGIPYNRILRLLLSYGYDLFDMNEKPISIANKRSQRKPAIFAR